MAEEQMSNDELIAAADALLQAQVSPSLFDVPALEDPNLDKQTGAPASVRATVGLIVDPVDRLLALRQFFPDAEAVEGAENFIFTNPDTGKPTLFNPSGLDVGDVAGVTREAIQFTTGTAGAVGGAIAGAPAGPAGAISGGILGSGLGDLAGGELSTQIARGLGAPDTRTINEIKRQMASDFLFGAGAQAVGPVFGAGFRSFIRGGIRGTGAAAKAARGRLAAFESADITPTPGQLGKKSALEGFESFLARFPGASGRIAKIAERSQQKLGKQLDNVASRLSSNADAEIAGEMITGGIQSNFIPRVRAGAARLYGKLDKLVSPEARISPDNFASAVDDLGRPTAELARTTRVLTNPSASRLVKAIGLDLKESGGTISFEGLQAIRTFVGNKLTNVSAIADFSRKDLKLLYGALSKDLKAAATQEAGKAGTEAFERANKFWLNQIKLLDNFLDPLAKRGERGGGVARVFKALESSGREGAQTVRAVKKSLTGDQWNVVRGLTIRRLGLERRAIQDTGEIVTGESFSSNSFLKNWLDLPTATKNELFGARGIRKDLDKIAQVARSLGEAGPEFAAPAASRGTISGGNILFGAIGVVPALVVSGQTEAALAGIGGLATAALGLNRITRLWTSPTFVRWLAKSTEIAPAGFGAHLARLETLAARQDPVTREAMFAYLSQFAPPEESEENGR